MNAEEVNRLIVQARRTNEKRDRMDWHAGFGAPDGGLGRGWVPRGSALGIWIRTARDAIHAGMVINDWSCVAEGLAMLEKMVGEEVMIAERTSDERNPVRRD